MTRKTKPEREVDVKSLARAYAAKSVKTLAGLMSSKATAPSARIAAAGMLLDRGFGKPQQSVDIAAKLEFTEIIRKIID